MPEQLMRLSVLVFMLGSLGGVGLRVTPREVWSTLRDVRFLAISFVTSWIVCPLAAVVVLHFVPLAQPYAAGLLLLSLAPCAPFVPVMVRTAGGSKPYLAGFMVLSAVTTVICMPVGVPILIGATVRPWNIARPLLLFVLLPLLVGMAVRERAPATAERLRPTLEKITAAAGVLMLIDIVILYGPGVLDAIGSYAIAAQMLFLVTISGVTHVAGAFLPADRRSVVTLGISTRNLGAALAPIAAVAPDPRGVVMIAISAVATLVWGLLVAHQLAGRGKRVRGMAPS